MEYFNPLNLFRKAFGTKTERELKALRPLVGQINALESGFQAMSDEELRELHPVFRQRVENGEPLDALIPETFAVVREVARRTLEMRHFDVQLMGGIVLHQGRISEMKTGEGKTLVATLPVYLNSLSGKGVHIVTVNDYLAQRDAEWMGKIYRALGLKVGVVVSNERNDRLKRDAYLADVTYGQNNEFGFDYLRDNMKFRTEDYVQRGHNYAIVDEVDSILIDEARTPLIISGPTDDSIDKYYLIDGVVPLLQNEMDYVIDEKGRSVTLTDGGVDKVEARLGVDNLYDPHNMEILHKVDQALKAHTLFKRDRDYVVREGKVVIVDEHTGRLMQGRRWSDGLHQAVEAKERLQIEAESQTYATITFQNYFRMYKKLAGMTGTAETEAAEFHNIYKLEVIAIPTNEAVNRTDFEDIVYKTQMVKFRKVMEEIDDCQKRGQPVLVGTVSVEKSEILHQMLKKRGIVHEVLNAKNHAREAQIIAQAGRRSAVTISTNMAGRGTDIKLGGDPEGLAKAEANPETENERFQEALLRHRNECADERIEVVKAGGLHILGTERHEARRIDNQLRGRSGRQGDPGSSRFYLSLEDDLLRIFGSEKIVVWMERMGLQEEEPIEHRWITKAIENAQRKVEGYNFNIRKNLLEYDDVMNQQRKAVYDLRRKALMGESIRDMMLESVDNLVDDILDEHAAEGMNPEEWNVEGLRQRFSKTFGIEWEDTDNAIRDYSATELRQRIVEEGRAKYETKEQELGLEVMRQVERMLLLQFADQLWKDHLLAMDRLRDGIGLRGYGQRNPLLEYKKEGFNMFMMMSALRDEAVISRLLKVELNASVEKAAEDPTKATARRLAAGRLQEPETPAPEEEVSLAAEPEFSLLPKAEPEARPAKGEETRAYALAHEIRRNDPCPCGSGKKYKKCCAQGESAIT